MQKAQTPLHKIAIYSLSFLWIFTGLTSIFFDKAFGYQTLANSGITGELADLLIYAGGSLDILIGAWLLTSKWTRACCIAQICVISIYTILLSILDPSFWLHPFGPLTKNLPIVVLILMIYSSSATKN
ncbi:DoxX-like family protein [Alkalimarinus coralli]|uniref:DoxX-like family protein n=1 Tax=Alkalimarinus coralli TaxID=2935863 RepID=UPI00202B2F4D|nr:DoxX-like family protein [Alkalimarinus coralli]